MSDVDQELEQAAFCRIHRSAIVNLERVRQLEISADGGTDVVLNSGTRLRLSRRYRKDLQARLGLHDA
jgi:two-component system LytT family response regulator